MCQMEMPMGKHMEMGAMGMKHMGMMHNMCGSEGGFPLIGDKMPRMEVKTTHGMMTLPDAFAGKWFVFFSHPADFTPVCTTESILEKPPTPLGLCSSSTQRRPSD